MGVQSGSDRGHQQAFTLHLDSGERQAWVGWSDRRGGRSKGISRIPACVRALLLRNDVVKVGYGIHGSHRPSFYFNLEKLLSKDQPFQVSLDRRAWVDAQKMYDEWPDKPADSKNLRSDFRSVCGYLNESALEADLPGDTHDYDAYRSVMMFLLLSRLKATRTV